MRELVEGIYTSCFAKAGAHPQAVAISRGLPRTFPRERQFEPLAPTRTMLQTYRKGGAGGRREFWSMYRARVAQLDPQITAETILSMTDGQGAILLCWERLEKPGDSCHRTFVGEWLAEHLGIEVLEWSPSPRRRSVD